MRQRDSPNSLFFQEGGSGKRNRMTMWNIYGIHSGYAKKSGLTIFPRRGRRRPSAFVFQSLDSDLPRRCGNVLEEKRKGEN